MALLNDVALLQIAVLQQICLKEMQVQGHLQQHKLFFRSYLEAFWAAVVDFVCPFFVGSML